MFLLSIPKRIKFAHECVRTSWKTNIKNKMKFVIVVEFMNRVRIQNDECAL